MVHKKIFLNAINDIFNNLQNPIKRTLFADDYNIYFSGVNVKPL